MFIVHGFEWTCNNAQKICREVRGSMYGPVRLDVVHHAHAVRGVGVDPLGSRAAHGVRGCGPGPLVLGRQRRRWRGRGGRPPTPGSSINVGRSDVRGLTALAQAGDEGRWGWIGVARGGKFIKSGFAAMMTAVASRWWRP
jgi:hypothetical protein